MSDESAPARKSRFLPAVAAFVIVALGVYITGRLTTWILEKVVLPLLAVIMGWMAARVVYKIRD